MTDRRLLKHSQAQNRFRFRPEIFTTKSLQTIALYRNYPYRKISCGTTLAHEGLCYRLESLFKLFV